LEKLSFHDEIEKNKRDSILLVFIVFIVVLILGYTIGMVYDPAISTVFIVIAAIIAFVQIIFSYYNGDKVVLASTGAREAKYEDYRNLHNSVEGLAIAAGIPKPKVYVIDSP
jgi:heat shock protein HtpX